jgi:Abnormal spindle-like microcephaly-assoc'd, ASPM-SPD-2-Hydin
MTWANSISGRPNRREHCDKGALSGSTTGSWRDLSPPQPENQITGSLSNGAAAARPFLVYDPASWVFAGTGLAKYNGTAITSGAGQNAIAGLIGYEFSTRAVNDPTLSAYISYEPVGLQQVGHSFVPAADNGVNSWADTTVYTSPGGGTVFSAGTIQWSWGVDNGFNDGFCDCNPGFANAKAQIITKNVLDRLVSSATVNPAPAVSLAPTSLSFGNQAVGQTSAGKMVTLTNSGSAALTITSVTVTGPNATDFAAPNTCPVSPNTLAAGASCTLTVTFTPSAAGTRAAGISVSDNASGSPHTVPLDGTGVTPAPGVTLTPTSVNFGNQNVNTTSSAQTLTLTNSGTAALTISGITLGGTNAADFAQTNTCPISPSTLAAGASCTLSVTFTPSATGARSASLAISDNAAGSPHNVPLTGTGVVSAPAVTLSPTGINFGSQLVGQKSGAQAVTLTNSGTAPLLISSISLSGTNAADFAQTNTCPISPGTLAPGANCTISVTFTPTATGARSASVSIGDNASGSPHSAALSGSGVTAASGITLVGSATANGNFGGGVKATIPAVQAGDLLIAAAGSNGSPSSWTAPTGWTTGGNGGHPDGQGLNWWWKIATSTDSGAVITLKSSSYADGGAIVLAYRGASGSPILAVSALATNDNGGNGNVTGPQINGVSWAGSASVVSLLLMSWQPNSTNITWPTGYTTQASATDGYGYVAAGANLAPQSVNSLGAQTATLGTSQAIVPTLQIAVLVG